MKKNQQENKILCDNVICGRLQDCKASFVMSLTVKTREVGKLGPLVQAQLLPKTGLPDFSWYNIPKWEKYIKLPLHI
jgi:hypothetical protein